MPDGGEQQEERRAGEVAGARAQRAQRLCIAPGGVVHQHHDGCFFDDGAEHLRERLSGAGGIRAGVAQRREGGRWGAGDARRPEQAVTRQANEAAPRLVQVGFDRPHQGNRGSVQPRAGHYLLGEPRLTHTCVPFHDAHGGAAGAAAGRPRLEQ